MKYQVICANRNINNNIISFNIMDSIRGTVNTVSIAKVYDIIVKNSIRVN